MMTKADALLSTFEALRVHRMIHQGEPASIRVRCNNGRVAECVAGWSKSAVNNNTQPVFLVIPQSADVAAMLPGAKAIEWGEAEFQVIDRKAPIDAGGYWLLSVREG